MFSDDRTRAHRARRATPVAAPTAVLGWGARLAGTPAAARNPVTRDDAQSAATQLDGRTGRQPRSSSVFF